MPDFARLLEDPAYGFLRKNEHLGARVMLLGLSGSYGYGTNRDDSDVDLRGVALQRPSDLLGLTAFEQYADDRTDTVVYGFGKFINLLLECNPNICEILGLPPENYLIRSPLGAELLNHRRLFLSKRAIKSFGGYASAQLRRLQNAIAHDALPQPEREKHVLHSVQNAMDDFSRRNLPSASGSARLYVDQAVTPGFETEIFMDADYRHLPLRQYAGLLDALRTIVRDYDKLSHRNRKKDANHLCKHAMHLVRLLMTGTDILEQHEIVTCRKKDLPLLMRIRNGDLMLPGGEMAPEFYEIVEQCERRFLEAAKATTLPDNPPMEKIAPFVERINRHAVMEDYG